jgi:hypothetical protein
VKRIPGGVVVGPPKMYRSGRVTVSQATAQLWRDYVREWLGPHGVSGVDCAWLFSIRRGCRTAADSAVAARRGVGAGHGSFAA